MRSCTHAKEGKEMDFFWEMLSLQETLFLLILLGILAKKLKIVNESGRKTLSDLLIYAILPCNIVESFTGGITLPDGFARTCILAVCISIGIQVLSFYGSKLGGFAGIRRNRKACCPTA